MGLGAPTPTSSGEWHRGFAGLVGNCKSPLLKQKQGSIQQARAVKMLEKVIWEAFNT